MRKKIFYLPLILLFGTMCSSEKASTVSPVDKGDGIYSLTVHNVSFEVDANNGGRISSFKLDGKEFLSGKDVNPDNWGSTFWTSPQSAWGWPPSPNIDKNKYKGGIEGNVISLTSDKDEKLGYTINKKFSANDSDTSVTIIYTITNNSSEKRKVAPWEITRVAPGGLTFYPSTEEEKKRGDLQPLMYDQDGIAYFQHDIKKVAGDVPKLFSEGNSGWMAHVSDRIIFVKKFKDVPNDKIAPEEGELEIYSNPDGTYIEIEEQGEYAELKPGKSVEWEIKWYLRKLPENIKAEKGNELLVQYVKDLVK
jgi:hypothetical protein